METCLFYGRLTLCPSLLTLYITVVCRHSGFLEYDVGQVG